MHHPAGEIEALYNQDQAKENAPQPLIKVETLLRKHRGVGIQELRQSLNRNKHDLRYELFQEKNIKRCKQKQFE